MTRLVDVNSTIVALATALGSGSIAVIRLSGKNALSIGNKIFTGEDLEKAPPNTIHFGRIVYNSREIDQVMVAIFHQPHSYTGENSLEISCHANPLIVDMIVESLLDNGAVMAGAGEFTLRAFLNGKIDLTQAEAVSSLIAAKTKHATKNALEHLEGALQNRVEFVKNSVMDSISLLELDLDFSEEDIAIADPGQIAGRVGKAKKNIQALIDSYNYARIFNSGLHLTIIGKPNSGKSTLLNVLLGENRAITSHIPGTTRDTISEEIIIQNILFKIVDTAGLREAKDNIEAEGIRRTQTQIDLADLILLLVDRSEEMNGEDKKIIQTLQKSYGGKVFIVLNKIDKPENKKTRDYVYKLNLSRIEISAREEQNIDELKNKIVNHFAETIDQFEDETVITSRRQLDLLEKCAGALERGARTLKRGLGNELAAIDLREALNALGELSGEITTDDILDNIFSKFCIGK